jgi:hypothetical protein
MDCRMSLKKFLCLLLSLTVYANTIIPSIISSTSIKTPHGFVAVENISLGDVIIAYDEKKLSSVVITHLSTANTNTIIAITTQKGTFYTCPNQQFYDPIFEQWIAAKDVTTQTTFLDAQLNHCVCLDVETIDASATKIYRITTDYPHNFFVTEQELLAHNAFPVVIGLAWLFGEGLKFAGLTIGTTLLGSYVGVKLHNRQKQRYKDFTVSFEVQSGGHIPDPNDDENNEHKINTITKTEFFKTVQKDYEHWRNNIYKRKHKVKGIENAEYLEWDYTHNDVEAYNKAKDHIGSISPRTLKLYKPAVHNRRFPGR